MQSLSAKGLVSSAAPTTSPKQEAIRDYKARRSTRASVLHSRYQANPEISGGGSS